MATLAVFLLLGGVSYAAVTLPANSVGNRELKNNAVTSAEVKTKSLTASDFADGQLPAGPRGPAGPAGPAGPGFCDDDLLCPGTDIPNSGGAQVLIDGFEVGPRLSAYLIDCVNHACTLAIAGLLTDNLEFYAWYEQAHLNLDGAMRTFELEAYNIQGAVVRQYHVADGIPHALHDDGKRFELIFDATQIDRVVP